jgi:outer membrane lipoprotein-sorting protein
VPCWRIQSTPKGTRSSQYTRSIVWIRKGIYAFARIENYVKDQLVRRLNYSDIQNVQGIWTARRMEMFDLTRASRTVLTLDELQYNVPLKDEDFTLQAIRRQ